jgi:hypothetical protein
VFLVLRGGWLLVAVGTKLRMSLPPVLLLELRVSFWLTAVQELSPARTSANLPPPALMAGAELTHGEEVRANDAPGGRGSSAAAGPADLVGEREGLLADSVRWEDTPEDLALIDEYRRAIDTAFPRAPSARGGGQARTGVAAATLAAAPQARAPAGARGVPSPAPAVDPQAAETEALRSRMLSLERQVAFLRIELTASRDRESVLRGALATAEADRDLAVAEGPRRTLMGRVLFRSRTGERFHLSDQCGHCGTEPVPLTLCLVCKQRAGW